MNTIESNPEILLWVKVTHSIHQLVFNTA